MKIKWLDGLKHVPRIGTLNTDDVKTVPDDIGRALIKQGQAVEIKPKTKKE